MVRKEREKTAIAYICLSVALLLSTFLGISFAWFTDTATGSGSAQFGTIDLGTVTANTKTNVMPGDTMSNLGSFTYSANAESAYWRATYEVTDIATGELNTYFEANPIAPEFGAISSSANLQTILLTKEIKIPTSLTNAYQEQTITIKITIDAIQQANLPAEASTPQTAFAYMDANNLNYATGTVPVRNYTQNLEMTGRTLTGIGTATLTNGELIIPREVTSMALDTFSNNTSITSVSFEEGSVCTSIGAYAFYSCTSLTSITIPSGITRISGYAFGDCTSLTSIIFANNSQITSIGACAFYQCPGLTSITIPSGVEDIEEFAFESCSGLKTVYIYSQAVVDSITRQNKAGHLINYAVGDATNGKIYIKSGLTPTSYLSGLSVYKGTY